MKVKALKEFLALYDDEKDVVIRGMSGITWEMREDQLITQKLTDTKREVCKLYIK